MANFLETLSTDENMAIVRFMSKRPYIEQWSDTLNPSNLELFARNGPFARTMADYYKSASNDGAYAGIMDSILRRTTPRFLKDVIEGYGRYFKHLKLTGSNRSFNADVMSAIEKQCVCLRSISLVVDSKKFDKYRALFANNHAHLEKLRLVVRGYGQVQYGMHAFPNLKFLCVWGRHLENLTPVLRSCRDTLEEVRMEGKDTCWHLVCTELYHCRKLSVIELAGGVQEREHVALLESFGPVLKRASLNELSNESCEQLVRTCPNLTCCLLVREMDDVRRMEIFGKQMRQVTIPRMDVLNLAECKTAFQACTGLTEIRCFESKRHSSEEMVQSLFLTPRTSLENIEFMCYSFSVSNMLLDAVRSTTRNLRSIDLTFLAFQDTDALVQLLKANRRLEVVKISQLQNRASMEDAPDKTVEIIGALSGHHALRELAVAFELSFVEVRRLDVMFADACIPFRCRPVEVVICGKRYSDKTARGVPVNVSRGARFL